MARRMPYEKAVAGLRSATALPHATQQETEGRRLLQRAVDRGVFGVQIGTEAVDHGDDREGDAGGDQRVFDGGSAGLVLQEAGKDFGHGKGLRVMRGGSRSLAFQDLRPG
jgi:hypothetical protein